MTSLIPGGVIDTGVHQDAIGYVFELTIKEDGVVVDVSGAAMKQVVFRKPDMSTFIRTASFKTTGVDGIINYATVAGDLNQSGDWALQAYATIDTWTGKSEVKEFIVYPNL